MKIHFLVLILLALIGLSFVFYAKNTKLGSPTEQLNQKIKGITMVAPPMKFITNPMIDIKKVNADWIALIPFAFTPKSRPEVHYGASNWQWWGESKEGIQSCIEIAKKNGLKVMLKPQVYIHGLWTGEMQFSKEEDWHSWEEQYTQYILSMLQLAIEYKVEMFCIGTEFCKSSELRETFWLNLIATIRSKYSGLLTYSDNWDHYSKVSFWNKLDYVGISAYFPLLEKINPSPEELITSWQVYVKELNTFSQKVNKKILFTEYGYLSIDGASGKSWELEKKINEVPINEKAQADCYQSLFESLWGQTFWAGGFVWKWFPEGMGHEGYPERDYTPQNKQASKVLSQWYSRNE
ncbi:MAG: hypothetical protein ABIO44_10545 [Saprospiraceae bacterium]